MPRNVTDEDLNLLAGVLVPRLNALADRVAELPPPPRPKIANPCVAQQCPRAGTLSVAMLGGLEDDTLPVLLVRILLCAIHRRTLEGALNAGDRDFQIRGRQIYALNPPTIGLDEL